MGKSTISMAIFNSYAAGAVSLTLAIIIDEEPAVSRCRKRLLFHENMKNSWILSWLYQGNLWNAHLPALVMLFFCDFSICSLILAGRGGQQFGLWHRDDPTDDSMVMFPGSYGDYVMFLVDVVSIMFWGRFPGKSHDKHVPTGDSSGKRS